MNYHFISFLFDIASWAGLSLVIAELLSALESYAEKQKLKTSLILLFVALSSGCFSVMTHGLPDTGFAWFSFITVGAVTLTQALFLSEALRAKSKDAIIIFLSFVTSLIKDLKGGVVYGNSR